jgi:hypothetical protein
MYQVIVAEAGQRLKLGAFLTKTEAVLHALEQREDMRYEVVNDQTGLLKAVIQDGQEEYILAPIRREIA